MPTTRPIICLALNLLVWNGLAFAQSAAPASAASPAPVPLNPQQTVLLDKPNGKLLLKGEVCLREGVLEMLVCLKRTKEHEAIFSVDTQARVVHAGLLALGYEPGKPVRFTPEYQAASGPIVEIFVSWTDPEGKLQRHKAQNVVRNSVRRYWIQKLEQTPRDLQLGDDAELRYDEKRKELLWYGPMSKQQRDDLLKLSRDAGYQKAIQAIYDATQLQLLKADWVFAGSGFATDPDSNEKFYLAESGDLICVANFATATIDLAVSSSAANDDLLYEAYTDKLPPFGTPVTIELIPKKPAKEVPGQEKNNPKAPPIPAK
ncbi:hypothetical protein GC163_09645 [bacterium]|nr:hypothetical protein [bacterium]